MTNLPLRQSANSPSVVLDSAERTFAITHGSSGVEFAAFIVRACNSHDALLEAYKFWLEAVQNSLALRLALTELPEKAGPVLVEMLQDAIAAAEGEQ